MGRQSDEVAAPVTGTARLATQPGYRFVVQIGDDMIEVTPEGIDLTEEQATVVLSESDKYEGHVFRVPTETPEV